VKNWPFLLVLAWSISAVCQTGGEGQRSVSNPDPTSGSAPPLRRGPDDLRQELDADAAALSRIPADPFIASDPLSELLHPVDHAAGRLADAEHLKLGSTYTFLIQYATRTPPGERLPRQEQAGGRLDFTAAWKAYEHENTAGSISLLVRSGTNIGMSQQFNLSDRLGSGVFLDCLPGGGPQEPITVNVLYWRQDLFRKRLSLYAGKIHPNEFISLSMFNNDERTQFLNGAEDGNLAVPSDGTYAGGAAMEIQATRHMYLHAVAVDSEGAQQRNIETLVDRKYVEGAEVGWFSGSPGEQYRNYRVGFWRDDTRTQGSGFGGGLGFEHEFFNGWTPFGRYAFATNKGTSIKEVEELGVVQTHPFSRRGDTFGAAFNCTAPTAAGKHHESLFESFYRFRLTKSVELGPDLEVSIHPTYAARAYSTALLGLRMRIIF